MTEAERLAKALDNCAPLDFDGYFAQAAALIRSQAAEIEALRADAERWRWWRLRFHALTLWECAREAGLNLRGVYVTTPELMDEVTDAARQS